LGQDAEGYDDFGITWEKKQNSYGHEKKYRLSEAKKRTTAECAKCLENEIEQETGEDLRESITEEEDNPNFNLCSYCQSKEVKYNCDQCQSLLCSPCRYSSDDYPILCFNCLLPVRKESNILFEKKNISSVLENKMRKKRKITIGKSYAPKLHLCGICEEELDTDFNVECIVCSQ